MKFNPRNSSKKPTNRVDQGTEFFLLDMDGNYQDHRGVKEFKKLFSIDTLEYAAVNTYIIFRFSFTIISDALGH